MRFRSMIGLQRKMYTIFLFLVYVSTWRFHFLSPSLHAFLLSTLLLSLPFSLPPSLPLFLFFLYFYSFNLHFVLYFFLPPFLPFFLIPCLPSFLHFIPLFLLITFEVVVLFIDDVISFRTCVCKWISLHIYSSVSSWRVGLLLPLFVNRTVSVLSRWVAAYTWRKKVYRSPPLWVDNTFQDPL